MVNYILTINAYRCYPVLRHILPLQEEKVREYRVKVAEALLTGRPIPDIDEVAKFDFSIIVTEDEMLRIMEHPDRLNLGLSSFKLRRFIDKILERNNLKIKTPVAFIRCFTFNRDYVEVEKIEEEEKKFYRYSAVRMLYTKMKERYTPDPFMELRVFMFRKSKGDEDKIMALLYETLNKMMNLISSIRIVDRLYGSVKYDTWEHAKEDIEKGKITEKMIIVDGYDISLADKYEDAKIKFEVKGEERGVEITEDELWDNFNSTGWSEGEVSVFNRRFRYMALFKEYDDKPILYKDYNDREISEIIEKQLSEWRKKYYKREDVRKIL